MPDHDVNYCPVCGCDILAQRQALQYVEKKDRMRIYEEVKTELEASNSNSNTKLHLVSPVTRSLPAPRSQKRRARIEITSDLIQKVRELREIRVDHKPLKIKEIAERVGIPDKTVNYIVYFLLKKNKKVANVVAK